MLERMKELASESASDSVDASARGRINQEFRRFVRKIDRTVTPEVPGQRSVDRRVRRDPLTRLDGVGGRHGRLRRFDLRRSNRHVHVAENAGDITLDDGNGHAQTITGVSALEGGTAQRTSARSASTSSSQLVHRGRPRWPRRQGAGGQARSSSAPRATNAGQDTLTINGGTLDLRTFDARRRRFGGRHLAHAQTALASIDTAIAKVNTAIGEIGAGQSRIQNAITNLKTLCRTSQPPRARSATSIWPTRW